LVLQNFNKYLIFKMKPSILPASISNFFRNMKKSYIFPGQGSQSVGMLREFYDNFSVAKQMFERANDCLKKDIKTIMFEGPEDLLTQTENAQPAIMLGSAIILEVLKQEMGKKINDLCDFVAGHSLGEYTALYASETITLEEALKLLKIRGEAFAEAGKISQGAMVALVGATIEQAEEVVSKAKLNGDVLQIANDNTVGQVVLSGSVGSISKSIEIAPEVGVKKAVKLQVSGAFHSELMGLAVAKMEKALKDVEFRTPKVDVVANYTAEIEKTESIKDNLLKQITGRVRWRETMINMEKYGSKVFVELGNGKVLGGMVGRTCPDVKVSTLNSMETLKEFINNM
jgi:[acyl-carrier-protein] S-malonyltransferase